MATHVQGKTPYRTLLEMHHPTFKDGYQAGRQGYFTTLSSLTDINLVSGLQAHFEENPVHTAQNQEDLYYVVGALIGQISGPLISAQPDEEDGDAERQQRLLGELRTRLGDGEQVDHLIGTIAAFWQAQDTLATTLDEHTYEQVLQRGSTIVLL